MTIPSAELSLLEKDQTYVWHPFTPQIGSAEELLVVKAEGAVLHTSDGRQIIDAIGSWWVNLHGHGRKEFAEVLSNQACQLEHVIFAGFTHLPAITLAEQLVNLAPSRIKKVFYSDNGSTAIEVALKMALQYWYNQGINRKGIIALTGGYHGDTFGAMSAAEPSPFTAPFSDKLFEVKYLNITSTQDILSPLDAEDEAAVAQFQTLINAEVPPAAFIYEPLIQGASGMRFYKKALLDALLSMAKKNGVICIADEVMTGFCRTGKLFASEWLTSQPDIICLSKGLTGGVMPLGVTLCTGEIYAPYHTSELLKTFFHGHSFTANPLACRVAIKSLELLLHQDTCDNLDRLTARYQNLQNRLARFSQNISFRQFGAIVAIEVHTGHETSYIHEARHYLYQSFLDKGVLLRPLGNVIYLLPPYTITDEQLEVCFQAIEEVLSSLFPIAT